MSRRKAGRPRSDGLARFVLDVAKRFGGDRSGPSIVRLQSGFAFRCVYRSSPDQTGAALVRLLEAKPATGKIPAVILNDRFVVCALEDWDTVWGEIAQHRDRYIVSQSVEVRHESRSVRYLEEWLKLDGLMGSSSRVAVAIRVRHRRTVAVVFEL